MPTLKKRLDFYSSEEGTYVLGLLKEMVANESYSTKPSYSANSTLYPNNLIPFVDKHMHYLRDHPSVDSRQYISNLRLMSKVK